MIDNTSISKISFEEKSINFAFLQQKGIQALQQFSSKTWTDHNTHDPGITILEAICYAITDLGHRIDLPIEDLLASQQEKFSNSLYKIMPLPQQTLPNAAITTNDFRKLIIDIDGVKNVFFEKASDGEKNIFYNPDLNLLSFSPTPQAISLKGLFTIQIEFKKNGQIDLNNNILATELKTATNELFSIEITFPYWDEVTAEWSDPALTVVNINPSNVVIDLLPEDFYDFYVEANIVFSNGKIIEKFPLFVLIKGIWNNTDAALKSRINKALAILIIDKANPTNPTDPYQNSPNSPINQFRNKLFEIFKIINRVQETFWSNRNIGEDLFLFQAFRIQEIALGNKFDEPTGSTYSVDIEIDAEGDPALLLAQIFFNIQQFLSPIIKPHSYTELSQTLSNSEIFEGPLNKKGFILDEDLSALSVKDVIYTSDLLLIIMNIPGVVFVNNFALSSFISNIPIVLKAINCIKLSAGEKYRPQLNIEKSFVRLYHSGVEIKVDNQVVLMHLKKLEEGILLTSNNLDFASQIKLGNKLPLDDYRSIQYELPSFYNVGYNVPIAPDSNLLKSQSNQLKAYLFHFDQALSNTLEQLNNISALFSIDPALNHTIFYKNLRNDPAFANLLSTSYESEMEAATEDPTRFKKRRNLFLDHLLARFAENISENSLINNLLNESINSNKDIYDKTALLSELSNAVSCRGQAFNYAKTIPPGGTLDNWNSNNVSGFEKRICHLCGILSPKRRSLLSTFSQFFKFIAIGSNFGFQIVDDTNAVILINKKVYTSNNHALETIKIVAMVGGYSKNYTIEKITSNQFKVILLDVQGNTIATSNSIFPTELECQQQIDIFANFIFEKSYMEGLYLVEHILLRPKETNSDNTLLQPIVLDEGVLVKDPYSYVLTLVCPSGFIQDFANATDIPVQTFGFNRFREVLFRNFFEKIAREEAPAQCLVNIFYLDENSGVDSPTLLSLNNFIRIYRQWLNKINEKADSPEKLELLRFINNLNQLIKP